MNHVNDDRYFRPGPIGNVAGMAQTTDSSHLGLGLFAGQQEDSFAGFSRGDFSTIRGQDQMDDRRSYYAQSVYSQTSFGQDNAQRTSSVGDSAEDCLNFLPPVAQYTLLDEWSQPVDILLSAQLAGLFSRETAVLDGPDEPNGPTESLNLICYRRNLISITGHVAIPAKLRLMETAQGQQIPVHSQEIVLSVFESLEHGRGGRLIQSLRSGPPISAAAEADSDSPGPEPISLDPEKAEEATQDQEYIIFPFEWQRLQFRKATPNNGKSRDRQKFFFVSIKVLANLADGQKVSISEASSNPIIVRGRGPQNFVAKDSQKLGRSRSLNSTSEGRLKKPNRHATRNSLLRQSLSRKQRADATSSTDAIRRMSIDDISELFRDNTTADVRQFNAGQTPFGEIQMQPTPPRDFPSTMPTTAAPWAMDLSRSSSIAPSLEQVHSNDVLMVMDPSHGDTVTWSPESVNDYHNTSFPKITSISPQDIHKNIGRNPSHPASPVRSGSVRSSSVGAENRGRPLLGRQHAFKEEAPRFVQGSVFHGGDAQVQRNRSASVKRDFPMSPPEEDYGRRSASVSLPNAPFHDGKLGEEKHVNALPITPMSPPKEGEIAAKPTTTPVPDKQGLPGDLTQHDPLPSPSTQFDIFEGLLAPFPSIHGMDQFGPHHGKIMTPIAEGLEHGPILGMADSYTSPHMPSISEPTESYHMPSFMEQLDSKLADQLDIIPVPPPMGQHDVQPSVEDSLVN